MFDHFLEIAYRQDQQHALRNEMAEHFKALPIEELQKIASGELKLADCDNDDWLSKFKTTPLYPQALSLEEELLQLDVAEQQRHLQEKQQDEQESSGHRQIYDAKDAVRLKKKMLELELRKLELQGQGAGAEAPVEGAPPAAAPPPVGGMSPPVSAPEAAAPKMASIIESMRKQAFLGIGVDIPVGAESRDPKSKWYTAISVGLPHGIAAVRRHRESGVGVGLGLTGPQISIRLGGKSSGEKNAEFEAADACGRLLAKEAAGGAAGLLASAGGVGGKALEVGRRLWSGVGGAGQTGAMIGAGAGALGGAAAGLRKDQQGHRSILGGITGGLMGAAGGGAVGAGAGMLSKGLPAAQAQLGILKNTVMPKGTGAGVSLSGSQGMAAHLPQMPTPQGGVGTLTGASIPTPIPAGGTAASNVNMWGAPETEGQIWAAQNRAHNENLSARRAQNMGQPL